MNEKTEIKVKVSTEVTLYSFWGWTDQESKNIEQLHEKLGKYLSWLTAIDKYVLAAARDHFETYKEKRISYKKRQIEELEQDLHNMKLDLALDIADKYKNGKTD